LVAVVATAHEAIVKQGLVVCYFEFVSCECQLVIEQTSFFSAIEEPPDALAITALRLALLIIMSPVYND